MKTDEFVLNPIQRMDISLLLNNKNIFEKQLSRSRNEVDVDGVLYASQKLKEINGEIERRNSQANN